ncbi:MAG: HdeD family acid-resistance protein [Candidatus Eremiobacteraeota bacterium]|nr:HdeD family acid-resistance protein [Candidatus Eremiobacteraeota bacterium]
MIEALSSRWWVFLVRGLAGVIFGVLAFFWPHSTLIALVLIFGVYMFIDGLMALGFAIAGHGGSRWWALFLEGILGLIVGILIWVEPQFSTLVFIYFVAGWAIATGVFAIASGIQLRDAITNEWFYIVSGLISIIFGFLILRSPLQGAIAVAWTIGFYAVLAGITQIAFAFRVRALHSTIAAPV